MSYSKPEVVGLASAIEAIQGNPTNKPDFYSEGGAAPLTSIGAYEADE
jgi:hypothetical protein